VQRNLVLLERIALDVLGPFEANALVDDAHPLNPSAFDLRYAPFGSTLADSRFRQSWPSLRQARARRPDAFVVAERRCRRALGRLVDRISLTATSPAFVPATLACRR
jgi:hypothetical protein